MSTAATIPGLRFSVHPRPAEPSPLRSDVAGFLGRTRRGPVGRPVRVEGWRGYLREFGGLDPDSVTSYAVRGYFENGGQVAWVVRLCGRPQSAAAGQWSLTPLTPGQGGFRAASYRLVATSPGRWAKDTAVSIRYWLEGPSGKPVVDFAIQAPDEPPEYLTGLDPHSLLEEGGFPSALIRLEAVGPLLAAIPPGLASGPRSFQWSLGLDGGATDPPARGDYLAAVQSLNDQPEVAVVSAPDLPIDLDDAGRTEIVSLLIERAEELRDRVVLVDLPCGEQSAAESVGWVEQLRGPWMEDLHGRAAAAYHPWLRVPDPLGGVASPLRTIPPSGHVAGVISRLDRERGAHHTPANAEVLDAIDLSRPLGEDEQALLFDQGINLLRCAPGQGLLVWGGRTLELRHPSGRFLAHRRLIHRLVRAIRRVAEPLVFDINGPELWLALVRAITTVLLEAWRAGALKGARPDEAFAVQCDERTNPPEERELGRVLCKVELAPAVPMEFIELRVTLSAEGTLEVFES